MTLPADLTVVVPLYNGARFIGETLDSILHQTLPVTEVVVVDDGSSDDGPPVVEGHGLRPRLIRQDHLGVAVARNHGLLETRTRWVAFLDQDDLWHPSRVARLLGWLGSHPDERLVMTTEIAFSTHDDLPLLSEQDPLVGSWASLHVSRQHALAELVRSADVTGSDRVTHHDQFSMLRGPVSVTTSFVADADLLRLAGGFSPHALAMDDYWLLTVAAKICPITVVDQPTVFYRVHGTATSRTTRLALPFLSSGVALRLGGGLSTTDSDAATAPVGPLHHHLLDELRRSPEFGDPEVRATSWHLARILLGRGQSREHAKALARSRAPWLRTVRDALRRIVPAKPPGPSE